MGAKMFSVLTIFLQNNQKNRNERGVYLIESRKYRIFDMLDLFNHKSHRGIVAICFLGTKTL